MLDNKRLEALKVAAFENCGNRAVFNRRHDPYLRKYVALLGYEFILHEIETCNYTHLDYFYSEKRGVIGRWDDIDKRNQESRYAEEKREVVAEAKETRVNDGLTHWDPLLEMAGLQAEFGPRHPKCVEFARKWNL